MLASLETDPSFLRIIEHRGPIPIELRKAIGNRVYGCDTSQQACPFPTKFAKPAREPGYAARGPEEASVGVEAAGSGRRFM
jgi:epoxyqueuosine reductase